jgi:hypothetical protein
MTGPMDPADPMNHSGSVWCAEHERWECSKNSKRTKTRCHAPAIRGLDRCWSHAGEKLETAKAKGEAITAWSAMAIALANVGGRLTVEPVVTTRDAVLGMLQMSWLRAHLYAGLLEEQVRRAKEARGEPGGREAYYGGDGDDEGEAQARVGAPSVGPGAGLIGHTFSGVKDIGIFASGEAIRGLAQLEAAERDRCVRFAKTAHEMKIDDQQIEIAKAQGRMLADVVRRISDGLLAAVLAALGAIEDPAAARVSADTVRSAWPGWVADIAPRELRAVAGGGG